MPKLLLLQITALLLRRMVELQQVEDSWPVVVVNMPAVMSA